MAAAVDILTAFLGEGMPAWAWAFFTRLVGLEETASARDPSANSEDRMEVTPVC